MIENGGGLPLPHHHRCDTMNRTTVAALLAVALVSVVVFVPATDADTVQDDIVYCYGDNPRMVPFASMAEGDGWTVYAESGAQVSWEENDDRSIVVHLADQDGRVVVEQRVGDDVARVVLIPIHLPQDETDADGVYTVSFHDGTGVIDQTVITNETTVSMGSDHVVVPDDPVRDGYSFAGWFTSDGEEFDPKQPVKSDMIVYARWMTAGGGQDVTVNNTFVVVFQVQEGFEYHIESVESDGVVFTVTVRDGYSFAGDPEVTTTSGKITVDGDRYTLSSITSNAVVTIVGNPIYDVNPDDPSVPAEDGGLPWIWIIVVIAIVLLALSAYMYYRSRQDDGTGGSRIG